MNKLIKFLSVLTITGLIAISAKAQTPAPSDPVTGFLGTFSTWISSFDTNNTMFLTNDVLELNSGVANGQNMEALFDIRVNPYKGLALGSRLYNQNALGTIVGAEAYAGWGFVHYDVRLTPELGIGYRLDLKTIRIQPGLILEKAMTQNTATSIGLMLPIDVNKGAGMFRPTVTAGVTVKF